MKPTDQKPTVITFPNMPSKSEPGKVRFLPQNMAAALSELDRSDWIRFDDDHALPVSILRDILGTWDKGTVKNPHGPADMYTYPGGLVMREYPDDQPRNRQTLYWQEIPANVFVSRLDLDADPAPAKDKPDMKWLNLALAKGEEAITRPSLARTYGSIAADGFRLHRDLSLPDPTDAPFDWRAVYPRPSDNLVTVRVDQLAKAVKSARTMNRETVILYFNGRLDVSGTSEEDGTVTQSITEGYEHAGPDVRLGIHPGHVLDALSGMSGDVVISIESPSRAILITDGKREAVIMPKLLE